MLSAADADLVRRAAAIPGLATVLDPEAFVAALRHAAPEADLRTARVTRVKLRPGAFCRVTYRVDVAGSELDLDVRACGPGDLARWLAEGPRARVPGALGPGRIVLRDCATLIMVFPNDLKLPELRHLVDAAERDRLLAEVLPDRPGLRQGQLQHLSYWPERRFVAALRARDGSRVLVKLYTAGGYKKGQRTATAFESSGPLRVARLLGRSDRRRLLAFEWLPGRLLADLCTAPFLDSRAFAATGAALAALHAQGSDGLDCWTRDEEAAYVSELGDDVGFIRPDLAGRAEALARRLAAELAGAPEMHIPVHGDFSPKQVLVGEHQAAIVDFDGACCADPALDLGNMLAQFELDALRGKPGVEFLREAFLEGYRLAARRSLPERITLYSAVGLLRKSRFPFGAHLPDWPQHTQAILERAEIVSRS